MKDIQVILSPKYGNTFHRSVRDDKGEIVETLEFVQGEIVRLPADLIPVIVKDLGSALFVVTEQNGRMVSDVDATESLTRELAGNPDPEPIAREPVEEPVEELIEEPIKEFAEEFAEEPITEPKRPKQTKKKRRGASDELKRLAGSDDG